MCGRDLKPLFDTGTTTASARRIFGRELGVRETIALSLRLYKRNFRDYLLVFVAAGVAIGFLSLVVEFVLPLQQPQVTSSFLSDFITSPRMLLHTLVLTAVLSPINAVTNGMGFSIAVDTLESERANLRQSYESAKSRIRQLWFITILTGFILDFASVIEIIVIIPEIIFLLAIPAVVIENRKGSDPLARSWQLVRKRWGIVFELLIVYGLIAVGPSLVLYLATAYESPIQVLASSIFAGIFAPFLITITTVFYYSSIVRLSEQPSPVSTIPSQAGPKLWVCRNCGAQVVISSPPKDTMFGGCPKGKKVTFTVPKHDWAESSAPSPNPI